MKVSRRQLTIVVEDRGTLVKVYTPGGYCYAAQWAAGSTPEDVWRSMSGDYGRFYPYNESNGVWLDGPPIYVTTKV